MKKLNICWPVVLAIALACTLTTCSNDQARREYEHEQSKPKIEVPAAEEFFTPVENFDEQVENIIRHK